MIFKKTRQIFIGLAISMALSCTALPAYALEYNYVSNEEKRVRATKDSRL